MRHPCRMTAELPSMAIPPGFGAGCKKKSRFIVTHMEKSRLFCPQDTTIPPYPHSPSLLRMLVWFEAWYVTLVFLCFILTFYKKEERIIWLLYALILFTILLCYKFPFISLLVAADYLFQLTL